MSDFHFSPRPNRANEIDWRTWGDDAFREAQAADKPVLLAISAVWCHWCHVMDETSYSDPAVIQGVNERYIPIRVDNDERPDVNRRYNMGGWPTTAFLTPDGEILNGATYIPPSITTVAPRLASDPKARPLARSAPVKIQIPRLGVNAPVMKLGRDADGTVQVPPLAAHNLTGWYRYGPSPGQPGPAVILGHVDSTTGTSVFYYLKNLHAGDTVDVTLADGTVARFAVDGLQKVAKDAFPTASVYGKSGDPSLRLITCGGPFDEASGHYTDNIIVYAHLSGS